MVSDSTERYISAAVPSLVYLTSLWTLDWSIYFLSAGSFTIDYLDISYLALQ